MTILPKCTTVDTTILGPGELLHIEFVFFNVTCVVSFTSILTVVCEKNDLDITNQIQTSPSQNGLIHYNNIEKKNTHAEM